MYEFELSLKHANERHEELVRDLQLERQLPRKAQTNLFTNAVNALKATFAPKATPAHNARSARHSLATK